MAPHSSAPAWKIPWTEEPGGLKSMGSPRVGHDCATSLAFFTLMHWRRRWHPTPVLLPGRSQDGGASWAAVHGVSKSQTQLSNFTFTFHTHALEKAMATHSSTLAGRSHGRGSLVGCRLRVAQSRTRLKQLSSSSSKVYLASFSCVFFRATL